MKRVTFANSNLQTCQGNAKNLGVEKPIILISQGSGGIALGSATFHTCPGKASLQ